MNLSKCLLVRTCKCHQIETIWWSYFSLLYRLTYIKRDENQLISTAWIFFNNLSAVNSYACIFTEGRWKTRLNIWWNKLENSTDAYSIITKICLSIELSSRKFCVIEVAVAFHLTLNLKLQEDRHCVWWSQQLAVFRSWITVTEQWSNHDCTFCHNNWLCVWVVLDINIMFLNAISQLVSKQTINMTVWSMSK